MSDTCGCCDIPNKPKAKIKHDPADIPFYAEGRMPDDHFCEFMYRYGVSCNCYPEDYKMSDKQKPTFLRAVPALCPFVCWAFSAGRCLRYPGCYRLALAGGGLDDGFRALPTRQRNAQNREPEARRSNRL